MSLALAYLHKTCDSCKKYLSVKPLHKYNDNSIKCGRCTQSNDGGLAVWFSDIPDNILFRCINHYEGCKSRLNHWEVTAHEKNCITSSPYSCPLCQSKEKKYSSLLLLHHLKSEHEDSILNKPELTIILSTREGNYDFIYYTEEFVFVVCIRIFPTTNFIDISIEAILTSGINFCDLSTQLQVSSKEPETKIDLEPFITLNKQNLFKLLYSDVQKCRSINLKFTISVNTELFEVDIAHQKLSHIYSQISKFNIFKKRMKLSGCRTALRSNGNIPSFCGLCKVQFYDKGVYKCLDNKHFLCSVCRHFDIEKCEEGKIFVQATAEEKLLMEQYYVCRWNCSGVNRFPFLFSHEVECKIQPSRKCPISSCTFHGILRKIFVHYQAEHSRYNIKLYDYWNAGNAVYILENIANGQEWHYYIIPHDLFVTIMCQEIDGAYKFTLDICDNSDATLKCCALIKYNEERGCKVEDNFSVTKNKLRIKDGKAQMDIKVFLCPKNM